MQIFPPGPVGISPRVDCVFKALLGTVDNIPVLLDFLNAVLVPESPIIAVEIHNPMHLPDFVGDDFTVVDVKASDSRGRIYQIEMQSCNEAALKSRILYTWADIFEGQLLSGQDYGELRPVISIWILDQNIHRSSAVHHRFGAVDAEQGVQLSPLMEIHTLELAKWRKIQSHTTALDRWLCFFAEAETWEEIPFDLRSPAMEKAMATLREFQVNRDWNETYRARQDGWRRQRTQEAALERALAEKVQAEQQAEKERTEKERERAEKERERAEKEAALAAEVQARAEKEAALAEAERLRQLLLRLGAEPEDQSR